jgi:hypothetical protein
VKNKTNQFIINLLIVGMFVSNHVIIIECQKIYLHINVLLEKSNISHNQWSMVKSMHRSRSNVGTATLRVNIYVGGGFVEVAPTNTVQVFCPGTGSWSMMINPMRVGWSWVKVVAMNSMLCVVGMGSRG